MSEIDSLIKSEIDSANIVLFKKGTPVFPNAGFPGRWFRFCRISAHRSKA